jgi:2-polyprenyl-6-methoxyphenol hydroxylase-like FAD-dependent oxidoreductase
MMAKAKRETPVLIVGAGPTGLVLALRLHIHGIGFRIIDNDAGPGVASRAIALHARTLEFYNQIGLADEIVARGIKMDHIQLRKDNATLADINLADMGRGLSPYPFMLNFPQDVHEQFLVEQLKHQGVEVEWNTSLSDFKHDSTNVEAKLLKGSGLETAEFQYICGCDGARSRVRQVLDLQFPGGTYESMFYVADIKSQSNSKLHPNDGVLKLESHDFAMIMPVRETGSHRIVGILPTDFNERPNVEFSDLQPRIEKMLDIKINELNWFSTYHVHHRVAEKFRVGRCFIAGDAGHIHSPAGGQGMNTGIGDAVNLSWKIAAVLKGEAGETILDTYETERIGFARKLVSTTDTAFETLVSQSFTATFLRNWIIPYIVPPLTRTALFRKIAFKIVSQIRISYRGSAMSGSSSGALRGGDRLPWIPHGATDNFASLQSLKWQIHVYGEASQTLQETARTLGVEINVFEWTENAKAAGVIKGLAYLLRPDGHIAVTSSDGKVISQYFVTRNIKFPKPNLIRLNGVAL